MSKGHKNLYHCQNCHAEIVTLDLDDGVTPMFLACKVTPDCNGMMVSSFYRSDQSLPHQYEWFKPESFKGYSVGMREHLEKGGLDLRRREINLGGIQDRLLVEAIELVRTWESVSAVQLQRKMKIIYPTAARFLDAMKKYGVVHLNKNSAGSYYVTQGVNWS